MCYTFALANGEQRLNAREHKLQGAVVQPG